MYRIANNFHRFVQILAVCIGTNYLATASAEEQQFRPLTKREDMIRALMTPPSQQNSVLSTRAPTFVAMTRPQFPTAILFNTKSAEVLPDSFPLLEEIALALQDSQVLGIRIEIAGHTDSRGSLEYNDKLSTARAESVKQYLIEKGVESSRLTTKGYGERQPIPGADEKTPEGLAANRRVEFIRMDPLP